jgi:hypothetical protein
MTNKTNITTRSSVEAGWSPQTGLLLRENGKVRDTTLHDFEQIYGKPMLAVVMGRPLQWTAMPNRAGCSPLDQIGSPFIRSLRITQDFIEAARAAGSLNPAADGMRAEYRSRLAR